MLRNGLLAAAAALVVAAVFIAWDQPQPDPNDFRGNPCDGSIVAAFYDVGDGHEAEPYLRQCRSPARRQLGVASALVVGAATVMVARSRVGTRDRAD